MHYLCDLHMHSTASDGQYSSAELVQMATERGLNALALTDHDTTAGLEEAILAGKQVGIRVIPGVELSAKEYPTFHILGYGFSLGGSPLAAMCRPTESWRFPGAPFQSGV